MSSSPDSIYLSPLEAAQALLGSSLGTKTETHQERAAGFRRISAHLIGQVDEITEAHARHASVSDVAMTEAPRVDTGLSVTDKPIVDGAIALLVNTYLIMTPDQRSSAFQDYPQLYAMVERQFATE